MSQPSDPQEPPLVPPGPPTPDPPAAAPGSAVPETGTPPVKATAQVTAAPPLATDPAGPPTEPVTAAPPLATDPAGPPTEQVTAAPPLATDPTAPLVGVASSAAPVTVAPPPVATGPQPADPTPGTRADRHAASWARLGHYRAAVARLNASASVLLLVSAFAIIATGIIGIPSAVLAIVALRDRSVDISSARRKVRVGWIVFVANAVVGLMLIGALLWWLRSQ